MPDPKRFLSTDQMSAVKNLKVGDILCGDVGSGKSRTGIAFYDKSYPDYPLYIITTAHKRDSLEWEPELNLFGLSILSDSRMPVVVDSWNNIGKYTDVKNAFFIFDEQRVVGRGAWVKSFLKITKSNKWILLSATPGDTWLDYVPVFIANGFFKNVTDFERKHVVYKRFTKWRQVDLYLNESRLEAMRDSLLVDIPVERTRERHEIEILTKFDISKYRQIQRTRCDIDGVPYRGASDFCQGLRKIVNTDGSKLDTLKKILMEHPKIIVFYNYDYELEMLRSIDICKAEWNGHKHEPIPKEDSWIYLVQYTAGCEGWNCIETDTMLFFSLNYSWKVMEQAKGRIDRRNTPFSDLYYYTLRTISGIDKSIMAALERKGRFNARGFAGRYFK